MRRRFYFPGENKTVMPRGIGRAPRKSPFELPLSPIKKPPKDRGILIYDFESKHGLSQDPGFDRPFMVGLLDHRGIYRDFWDDRPLSEAKENYQARCYDDGEGCVAKFARAVLGYPLHAGYHVPEWVSKNYDFYAHNGGRFDVTPLLVWLYLRRDEFHVEVTFVQGRVQSLRVSPARKKPSPSNTVSFLDSYLILPMRLSQATSLFSRGQVKQADFDQKTPEWERDKWRHYNRLDCEGLRDALLGFKSMLEQEGGELAMTLPSASMKIFRRRFLKEKIDRAMHFEWCDGECGGCDRGDGCDGKCHGCLHDWIRKGYFGGRVEIFQRFAPAPIFYYDLNSSYPASMLKNMPVGKPLKIQEESEFFAEHKERFRDGQVGFVEATVSIPPSCRIPPLPVLSDGKLKFPAGYFSGVFEYEELMSILDPFVGGRIEKVKMAVWFEGKPIFKDFVDTLYKYKLGKPKDPKTQEELDALALAELAKLLLNSLYGKFAQNAEREELLYIAKSDPWPDNARPIDGRHETCPFWLRPRYVSPSYIMPHVSARITALSRQALWQQNKRIVQAGGRVFYNDTDAVVADGEFDGRVVHPTRLGAWKREYPQKYLAAQFVLPKLYALFSPEVGVEKPIVHMKGVPREMQNLESFEKLVAGETLFREKNRTSQPKTVLRGLHKGGPMGIHMLDSIKKLRTIYDKRIVLEDGTTMPVVIDER
jgi:hypothetical protein